MFKNDSHTLLKFVLLGFFIVIAGLVILVAYFEQQLPTVEEIKTIRIQMPLRIYNSDGQLYAEFGEMRRIPVQLQDIPQPIIDAIVATEDQRYFEHPGVDVLGLLRAGIELVVTGRKTQGGSTITMQVARNFFLTREKTFNRKIREILLALKISRELSKEKVLELYLNGVYLGNRAYGVAAAAQVYFGKTLDQLTLGEIATIAGLPKAPSVLNPLANPAAAKDRRQHVLDRMLELNYISKVQYDEANNEPINTDYHAEPIIAYAPYAAEMVRAQILQQYGDDAYTMGLQVYTTINNTLQHAAVNAVRKAVTSYDARFGYQRPTDAPLAPNAPQGVQGALVALNPQNGAILALVGGYSFEQSNFNRIYQAQRQPGSSFKPLIYAAALDKGLTLATVMNDAPFVAPGSSSIDIWRPENDDMTFMGPIRLRIALLRSRNLVSVRVLQNIGVPYALDYLKRFGFDPSKMPTNLSLVLGSADVTPIQMALAFSVFANGGYKVTDYLIDHIVDEKGNIIYQAQPLEACETCISIPADAPQPVINNLAPRVISPQIAYLMTSALQSVIQGSNGIAGTGQPATALGRTDIAGKTGTPNEQKDGWFNGFNSDILAVAWMGFDQPKSLREYAASTALPMWIDFMRVALQDKPLHTMPRPPGLVSVRINPTTGDLASPGEKDAVFETFIAGTEPTYATQTSSGDGSQSADQTTDNSVYGGVY